MLKSLKEFRDDYLETVLNLLWEQWTAIGVPGHITPGNNWIIDPDALILFTCIVGRYESRIFDSMLEWLQVHERLVNIQRMKTILKRESLHCGSLLSAIAGLMENPVTKTKWRSLAVGMTEEQTNLEPLFYTKEGIPHPSIASPDPAFKRGGFERNQINLRYNVHKFNPNYSSNLILSLRALLGVNSRCEIIAYLLTHGYANACEIANAMYYHPKTIYNALAEMHMSGKLYIRQKGKEKLYHFRGNAWQEFLSPDGNIARWLNWPFVFSILERILLILDDYRLHNADPLLVSSEFKLLMKDIESNPIQSFPLSELYINSSYSTGKSYLIEFQQVISNFLKHLR